MVVNKAVSSYKCQAAKKFGVTECNLRFGLAPSLQTTDYYPDTMDPGHENQGSSS
ncbi:unnamed protein product, partial [Gadus morhua 'NCC']